MEKERTWVLKTVYISQQTKERVKQKHGDVVWNKYIKNLIEKDVKDVV